MLRGEELATRLACIGFVVGDQEFVGIAKQIDMGTVKIPKIQAGYTFKHSRQAVVLFLNGVAKVPQFADGVKINEQTLVSLPMGSGWRRLLRWRGVGREVGIQVSLLLAPLAMMTSSWLG